MRECVRGSESDDMARTARTAAAAAAANRYTHVVVVLPAQVDGVHIHPPIISPIVRQRNNQLNVGFARSINNLVKSLHVDSRLAVRSPALENNIRAPSAFATVLRQAGRVVSGVLVVETPGAEDLEAGLFRGRQTCFDVCLVVVEGEVLIRRSACVVSLAGFSCDRDSHVCVATGEVKVLAVQFEFRARSRHEAFGGVAGKCCCCGRQQSEGGEAGQHRRARRSRVSRR